MESLNQNFAQHRKKWIVLYTKSRQEKVVADRLQQRGIESFCPTVKTVKFWSDRKKNVDEPLLKSYCFVYCNELERLTVLQVPGVVRFVYWMGKPAEVPQKALHQLRIMVENFSVDAIKIKPFAPGQTIEIKTGHFKNKKAEIVEVKPKKVIVRLESIGLLIEIDTTKNRVEQVRKIA